VGAASLANDYEATGNSHTITVVASDGNGGTTTITVTLNELDVDDSSPVIIDAQAAVYEEGLPGGFPDGNDSPTTATGQVDINDPDTVGGPLTVTLAGPVGLISGGEVVTWSGTGSVGDPLIGRAGGEEVINATIDNEGNYTVTLLKPLDHLGGEDEALDIGLTITADDGVNPPATGTLTVTVHDDAPVANPGAVDVVLPEQDTNVMLILDISTSMTASRVAGMKAAVTELLDTYAGLGNVAVQIVVFGTAAGTQAWGTSWGDIDAAKAYVSGINANSAGTNYDAALLKAMDAFDDPGKIAGGKNVSYFLTDGEPNQNTDWGIPGSGANGINDAEEEAWIDFLEANQIFSHVFGMEVPTNQQGNARGNMDRIAYDGIHKEDTNSVFVNDINDLPPILRDSAIDAAQGAVVDLGGTLGGNSGLGADGGGLLDITVNGRTYHDDGSVTGGTANGLFDAATNTWNILTEGPDGSVNTGGRFIVNMETGEYSYTPPIIDSGTRVEDIGFTLIDNDGDTASSTLTITVHPVGTVLPDSPDGGTSFAFHGDEGITGATGEQTHALPALTDLVASYGSGSLDASLPGSNMQAFSGSLAQVAMPLPLVHPLDELDQHHQAMV
ncbi:VWA domain-containing protein, partial [Stenotrophomonas sp. Iso1]|uniref:VWA domain-containing protein n=1 Tax=Stenotrophomonas sp. Iso1 TaxID=2977283 RepID=UPI0022B7CD81